MRWFLGPFSVRKQKCSDMAQKFGHLETDIVGQTTLYYVYKLGQIVTIQAWCQIHKFLKTKKFCTFFTSYSYPFVRV